MVLSPIDYVIIALYFIVIVAIGFIAARFAKTKEDYLVAGRRLSFPCSSAAWPRSRWAAAPLSAAPSWATSSGSAASGST
ncbi:MAG: hypothetical protein ACLSVD_06355 [Eggerthellaceae bacterium]